MWREIHYIMANNENHLFPVTFLSNINTVPKGPSDNHFQADDFLTIY